MKKGGEGREAASCAIHTRDQSASEIDDLSAVHRVLNELQHRVVEVGPYRWVWPIEHRDHDVPNVGGNLDARRATVIAHPKLQRVARCLRTIDD